MAVVAGTGAVRASASERPSILLQRCLLCVVDIVAARRCSERRGSSRETQGGGHRTAAAAKWTCRRHEWRDRAAGMVQGGGARSLVSPRHEGVVSLGGVSAEYKQVMFMRGESVWLADQMGGHCLCPSPYATTSLATTWLCSDCSCAAHLSTALYLAACSSGTSSSSSWRRKQQQVVVVSGGGGKVEGGRSRARNRAAAAPSPAAAPR